MRAWSSSLHDGALCKGILPSPSNLIVDYVLRINHMHFASLFSCFRVQLPSWSDMSTVLFCSQQSQYFFHFDVRALVLNYHHAIRTCCAKAACKKHISGQNEASPPALWWEQGFNSLPRRCLKRSSSQWIMIHSHHCWIQWPETEHNTSLISCRDLISMLCFAWK